MNLHKLKMKIKKNDFIYNLYNLIIRKIKMYRMNTAVKKYAYIIMEEINKLLLPTEVMFFLDFGSLLGIVRDGKFLDWDLDVDYGICINDMFKWSDLEKILSENGYKKTRQFKYKEIITEQTYEKNGLSIDFFNHVCDEGNMIVYSYYRKEKFIYNHFSEHHVHKFKTTKITGTQEYIVNGNIYYVPIEFEQYLSDIYSKTWKIPNPDWKSGSGPACEHLGDKEIAFLEKY